MPSPRSLPAELLDRPFLLADVRRLGLPDQVVRGRRFRRVFRGVYVSAALPDTLRLRARAARLILPGAAVFSHTTAAHLRDLPAPEDPRLHVTAPPDLPRPRAAGIVAHKGRPTAVHLAGLPVTTAERTFTDLARRLGLVDVVTLGDAMVRKGFVAAPDLLEAARRGSGRGIGAARRAAGLVRGSVDSPMETRLRLLLVLAGLPCPMPGGEIHDREGQWVATVDLQYTGVRVAIEYDGDLHRTSKRKWRHDVAAREILRDLGWRVIVVTADDVYVQPGRTLVRVHQALLDGGHCGVPATLSTEWQDYFQPRGYLTDRW